MGSFVALSFGSVPTVVKLSRARSAGAESASRAESLRGNTSIFSFKEFTKGLVAE